MMFLLKANPVFNLVTCGYELIKQILHDVFTFVTFFRSVVELMKSFLTQYTLTCARRTALCHKITIKYCFY